MSPFCTSIAHRTASTTLRNSGDGGRAEKRVPAHHSPEVEMGEEAGEQAREAP
jgi:hypothetical protein